MARPSSYTEEIADEICERLVDGESLKKICDEPDMPSTSMVFRWLADDKYASFRDRYARAREVQADTLFDDCLSIADQYDASKDREDVEHIARARLRIDTRKWMAGKLRPQKYSDKIVIGGDKALDPIQNEEVGANVAAIKALVSGIAERNRDSSLPPEE